jgi:hypothetical protein
MDIIPGHHRDEEKYGDDRRTEITGSVMSSAWMLIREDVVVSGLARGYIAAADRHA